MIGKTLAVIVSSCHRVILITGATMESRAKLMGPCHSPAVGSCFPAGLLLISLLFDGLRLLTGQKKWSQIAYWNMVAGVGSGYLAAIPGLIDWWFLPKGSRARRIGTAHAISNNIGLGLFIVSLVQRGSDDETPSNAALLTALAGASAAWAWRLPWRRTRRAAWRRRHARCQRQRTLVADAATLEGCRPSVRPHHKICWRPM